MGFGALAVMGSSSDSDDHHITKAASPRIDGSGSGEDTFYDSQAWLESSSADDLHIVCDEPFYSCAASPDHETRTSISSASSSNLSSPDNNDTNTCHSRHESSSSDDENELLEDRFWGEEVVEKQSDIDLVPDYYNTSKERKLYELSQDRFWSDNKVATSSYSIGESHLSFFNLPLTNAETDLPNNKSSQARLEEDRKVTGVKNSRCCSCFSF